jgi:hypothetical protein
MTINIADNNPRVSYSLAAGVTQTSFAVPFEFFDNTDILVYIDSTLKTLSTDYTVSGGNGSVGTITMSVTGPATVALVRDITIERSTDFPTAGPFSVESLNVELDKQIAIDADLEDQIDRAVRSPIEEFTTMTLPDATTRADKILKFDTSGNVAVESASALAAGAVVGANFVNNTFTGNGSQTAFTTTVEAGSKNNAQVYIDGVYQLKSSFSVSGTTLTFTEAPPLNSQIEVIIGKAIDTLDADSGNINYNQGATGAQTRTVESKLKEYTSAEDFGPAANGTTNDATALQNAINAVNAAGGGVLDLQNKTYRVDTSLTIYGKMTIKNGTLDFSNQVSTGSGQTPADNSVGLFLASGIATSQADINATVNRGDHQITVVSTTNLAANDVIYLRDPNVNFGDGVDETAAKKSEYAVIRSIDSATQFTLQAAAEDTYTSSTGVVDVMTPNENVVIENLRLIGNNDGTNRTTAINLQSTRNAIVRNVRTEKWQNRGVRIAESINARVEGCEFLEHNNTGLGYGVTFTDGCYGCVVDNCNFIFCKHGVAIGGGDLVSRGTKVSRCSFRGSVEQAIDGHQGTCDDIITENYIAAGDHAGLSSGQNGINYRGGSCVITNNMIDRSYDTGIAVFAAKGPNREKFAVITGNTIKNMRTGGRGIICNYGDTNSNQLRSLIISNNAMMELNGDFEYGIEVHANTETISNLVISGNTIDETDTYGIYLHRSNSKNIQFFTINNNVVKLAGGTGFEIGAGSNYGTIVGNLIYGINSGDTAMDIDGSNITVDGNQTHNTATGIDVSGGTNITSGDNG